MSDMAELLRECRECAVYAVRWSDFGEDRARALLDRIDVALTAYQPAVVRLSEETTRTAVEAGKALKALLADKPPVSIPPGTDDAS